MSTATITPQILRTGSFSASGYKHACNVIICASLAMKQKVRIPNAPEISDTLYLCHILEALGGEVTRNGNELIMDNSSINKWKVPTHFSEQTHGAVYFLPALLGRFGKVRLGKTGGCMIGEKSEGGERPIRHMVDVLSRFGAQLSVSNGIVSGTSDLFRACEINIADYSDRTDVVTGPLVSGATKTAIIAAFFVENGRTIIKNPYRKPDVTELLRFASNAGYHVDFSPEEIRISKQTEPKGMVTHFLVDDISIVMTYITLSLYYELRLTIQLHRPEQVKMGLKAELELLQKMGVKLRWTNHTLTVPQPAAIRSVDIAVTSQSIYSDHQPFFALLLTKAEKQSSIEEFVWENRFTYASELNKLGKQDLLQVDRHKMSIIPGTLHIGGQTLRATDLRAAAVLLLAALGLNQTTTIENIEHLDRGYENLVQDLECIGAKISVLT